jgi:hypothetical protein
VSTNEKKRTPEEEDFLGYDDEDILVPQYGIAMRIVLGLILVAIPVLIIVACVLLANWLG